MTKQSNMSFIQKNKYEDQLFMTRESIEMFTGGAIKARSIANLDSLGLGPPNKMRLGRKVVYQRDAVMEWLQDRLTDCK